MKRIILTVTLIIPFLLNGQVSEKTEETYNNNDTSSVTETDTTQAVNIDKMNEERSFSINEQDDELHIDTKKKSIVIDDEGMEITNKETNEKVSYPKKSKKKKFDGHYEGIDIGAALFTEYRINDSRAEITGNPSESFMNLNTSRSFSMGLNLGEQNFKLVSDVLGIVAGVGLEWTNYHFDNMNSITKDAITGNIIPLDYDMQLKKSKLSMTYLNVPVLLEVHPFGKNNKLYMAGGIVGGVKLFSSTKVVYWDRGDKKKQKERGDYNLNPLRYGYMARIGYNDFGIFGMFYPVKLFETEKGPELYPINIGISFQMD